MFYFFHDPSQGHWQGHKNYIILEKKNSYGIDNTFQKMYLWLFLPFETIDIHTKYFSKMKRPHKVFDPFHSPGSWKSSTEPRAPAVQRQRHTRERQVQQASPYHGSL